MLKTVKVYTAEELVAYYDNFFGEILQSNDRILYVGYEDRDLLLPILASKKIDILAIDREQRKDIIYENVHYRMMDFKDADKCLKDHFDFVIFSFMLHENESKLHSKFVELAKFIADNIIVIEPLARRDLSGKKLEKVVERYFAKYGQIKHYYNEFYWRKTVHFNAETDLCIMLQRTEHFEKTQKCKENEVSVNLSIQDIIVLVCRN